MCFAILEVKYRGATGSNELIKIEDEAAFERRFNSLKENELVDRIRVFTPSKTLTRRTTWEYTTPTEP